MYVCEINLMYSTPCYNDFFSMTLWSFSDLCTYTVRSFFFSPQIIHKEALASISRHFSSNQNYMLH